MQLRKDIWRCAIVPAPVDEILARASLGDLPLTWIPGSGNLRYHADPFGLWRGNMLYVFTEKFDYRDAIGTISVSVFDSDLALVEQTSVLQEPWHLSYPFVFEADGETWLLPEAFQSGGLWLYRAMAFPYRWERAHRIELGHIPLDATPFHDGSRWWLFYAPAFPERGRLSHLHAAWADRLEGPWTDHPANPVLVDVNGARPGGTPLWRGGVLHLPIQDCRGTYGAALRLLRFERLEPDSIILSAAGILHAPSAAAPYRDGCHTLSAAGPVTLIDVKRTIVSPRGLLMRPLRELRRSLDRIAGL
ncbi:glucosamine inositolphosphorylceramide transferase family protein [Sphingomonas abietis]|uniref:Formyl transferase n=1 Tax=Sphingomonas abietis TaxID=3012344 RepID=A0ABY7NH29_9SPHN|nr:formyl transferase [Sphingomonas abietis]WBO20844.1 formyl transferase [Sphingomonas abietis]